MILHYEEETIIFGLIERAQYRRNRGIYTDPIIINDHRYSSFLEYMMIETERLHAKVRRYTSPEEHAFYENHLPDPVINQLSFPHLLSVDKSKVNVNDNIMSFYLDTIIGRLCTDGDDEQHGSSVLCDINILQSISRRVHIGKFVAESKFQKSPDEYRDLVDKGDVSGILKLLTNVEVERQVMRRAFCKVSRYGQGIYIYIFDRNISNVIL